MFPEGTGRSPWIRVSLRSQSEEVCQVSGQSLLKKGLCPWLVGDRAGLLAMTCPQQLSKQKVPAAFS